MKSPEERWRWAPLGLVLPPLVWLGPALGAHKAPGLPTGMLFGQLAMGQNLRQALVDGAAGWAWPENLALSMLQVLLGGLLGDGLVIGVAVCLGMIALGLGAWKLARVHGASPASALCLGLLLQLSPPVLRAIRSGELGWLALGPALWALARAGQPEASRLGTSLLALLAGAWSPAGAVLMGVLGLRHRWLLVGLLPLFPALFSEPAALLGAARLQPPLTWAELGVVGSNLAVLPSGSEALPNADSSMGLHRLPAGVAIWSLGFLGLAGPRRRWAAAGIALLALWTLVFGWLPDRGVAPPIPHAWLEAVAPWCPGLRPPVGALVWLIVAIPPLILGLTVSKRVVWLLPLGILSLGLEEIGPVVPVTNLEPDPALAALEELSSGTIDVFPGSRGLGGPSPEELRFHLAAHRRQAAEADRGLLLHARLSQLSGQEVRVSAAQEIWENREADPIRLAQDEGIVALVIDLHSLDGESVEQIDAWLATQVGQAIAKSPAWAVYRVETLGAE